MKKILITCLFSALVVLSLPLQAAEKLTFDDKHSYVLFRIKHLGFSTQTGKWFTQGFVILDKDHPQNSKVEASIELSNVITGIPELDKHLKSKLFFDIEHYPKATFVSDKVEVKSKDTAKVHGLLTIRGITKPVRLLVKLNKVGKNPINDRMTAGFSATTKLKRSDFGMKALLPDLDDEVIIEIGAEAYQPSTEGDENASKKH